MELRMRNCGHLHFFQVIRNGSVTKVLNVTRGKPALVFKKVADLYESSGVKGPDAFPSFKTKDERVLSESENSETRDSSFFGTVERKKTESCSALEPSKFSFAGNDDAESSLPDGYFLENMTLSQIKERCKMKRKRPTFVDADASATDDASKFPRKEVCNYFLSEEDERDLKEPLISWKNKIKKNVKGKQKSAKRCIFGLPQSAKVVIESEQILSPQPTFSSDGKSSTSAATEAEDEPPFFNLPTVIGASGHSSEGSNKNADSSAPVYVEVPYQANEFSLITPVSSGEESWPCFMNDMQHEDMDQASFSFTALKVKDEPHYPDSQTLGSSGDLWDVDNKNAYCSVAACFKVPNQANECCLGTQVSSSEESEPSFSNKVPYKDTEQASIWPDLDAAVSVFNNLDVPKSACQHSDMLNSNGNGEPCNMSSLDSEVCSESDGKVFSDNSNNCEDLSSTHEITLQPSSSSQHPVSSCNSLLPKQQSFGDGTCVFQDKNGSTLLSDHERSTTQSITGECSSSWHVNVDSTNMEKQSDLSANHDTARNCSDDTATHELADDHATLKMFENFHDLKLQHTPGRIFSARKVISPTSQERLRKLMGSTEQLDDFDGYMEKLYFKKQGVTEKPVTERTNLVRRAGLPPNPKQTFRKQKNIKKGSPPKGTHKVSQLPGGATPVNSMQSCSQNAIAFSQRQMQDIDNLASKLMTELNSMKDIMEDTLYTGSSLNVNTKYTADEVKMAIENAMKVKETARKWLSMMARDCTRFCKIMRLIEDDCVVTKDKVNKERRKIVFADEAGGELCRVKYIEDNMASLGSNSETQEVLIE